MNHFADGHAEGRHFLYSPAVHTFAIDDVDAAVEPPRTRPLSSVVGDVLALGGDAAMPVVEGPLTHPLIGAVHLAFSEHRPLVLSPDAIWLTIAQGLARHVRLNAASLRGRLVRHDAKKRLTVVHRGPFPEDAAGIATLIDAMRGELASHIGDGSARLFVCDFSTSTDVERLASEIVLLDAYSPFYDYGISCVCGIPELTLTGSPEDWRSIRARIDALAELTQGSSIAAWPAHLGAVVKRLIAASEGRPDRAFFQRIYKPKTAYGAERVTGWIAWLYPYVGVSGRYDTPNPLLAHAPDAPLPGEDRVRAPDAVGPDWWGGPGITLDMVPPDVSECLFRVTDEVRGTRFDVTLRGGLAAVSIDERDRVVPRAAWWCKPGAPSMDEITERMFGLPGVTPAGATRRPSEGTAELHALQERVAAYSLFGDAIRSVDTPMPIAFEQGVYGTARVELADGTLLVGASTSMLGGPVVYGRVRASSLAEQPGARGVHMGMRCALPLAEIPVVATSLASFLGAALDAGGIPPLPSLGSLYRFVDDWHKLPRLNHTQPSPFGPQRAVPLAPRTTLELGGTAAFLTPILAESDIAPALEWAEKESLPVFVLGGGSNLIVSDAGFRGLVLAMESRGVTTLRSENDRGEACMRVTAAAGEPWDELVALTVRNGWQGLECLSGIPGLVGATPVQNVGAYGQEVADTIVAVGVVDRKSRMARTLAPRECQFAYRDSALKRDSERYVVSWVCFELRVGAPPALRYAELQKALADHPSPSLDVVRETVIALRRKKSMVLDAFDPNRRSAGSFFTNPIVSPETAAHVVARAMAAGIVKTASEVPRWPEKDGRVKLAAGWLIERAGVTKGTRVGNVGISSAHALALVHHGGGTTAELLALADDVRRRVREAFGVELEREPVLLGER